jgi:DNA-binding Xre family transcriptional regulator
MGKKVIVLLHKLLDERGMSMRQLSLMSGVRVAALHELANQKRQNINFGHIERIGEALRLTDMNELLTWVDTEEDDDN